jgi:hypothetical protein
MDKPMIDQSWLLFTFIPCAVALYSIFWIPLFFGRIVAENKALTFLSATGMLIFALAPMMRMMRWIERDPRGIVHWANYLQYVEHDWLLLLAFGMYAAVLTALLSEKEVETP